MSARPDPSRVLGLFREAIGLDRSVRAAFLDAACGLDEALRHEVEALIASDEDAERENFLAQPVAVPDMLGTRSAPVPGPASIDVTGVVGPYRILEPLGSGGMGSVYLAQREDLGNRVALKLAHRGAMSAEVRVRFEQEQRVLARLDHPGIARLLDAGTTRDGTPFIAMEYVEGCSLVRFADEEQLSAEARLRLLIDVCDAVQYAHRNLVVHRDLKPSNILVRADGAVKLLDFGIAKLLGATDGDPLTRTGVRPMTPEYAAPEQILSQAITTATDVYALGVLLFELLTGERPFRLAGRSTREIERVVCEQPAPRPSSVIARRIPVDLDTIVLKALRKEPDARYASVADLAADLQRFLDGKPVLARSQTWAYRGIRFVRRHRLAVSVFGFLAVVVPVALLHEASLQRAAREASGLAAAEAMKAYVVADFMTGLFADPFRSEVMGADQVSAVTLLDRASDRLLLATDATTPTRAVLLRHAGSIYAELQMYDRADSLLRSSRELFESLPDVAMSDLAETQATTGYLRYLQRRQDAADSLLTGALDVLSRTMPGSATLASAQRNLALVRLSGDRFHEADSLLQAALATWERAPDEYSGDIMTALLYRGDARFGLGDVEGSLGYVEAAVRLTEMRWGKRHAQTARIKDRQVRAYRRAGYPARADSVLFELASLQSDLLGPDHEWAIRFRDAYVLGLESSGRWAEVEHLLQATLAEYERGPEREVWTERGLRIRLAQTVLRQGRPAEAERLIQRVQRDVVADAAAGPFERAWAGFALAAVRESQGRFEEAARLYSEEARVRREYLPGQPWLEAAALGHRARLLHRLGSTAEAEGAFVEALERVRGGPPFSREYEAYILYAFARLLLDLGRSEDARVSLLEAREAFIELEMVGRPDERRLVALLDSLGG